MLTASVEPTDRSMPPMRMTSASPTAIIPMSATCVMMLSRLRGVRKYGDRIDIAMKMTTRPISGPGTARNTEPSRPLGALAGAAGAAVAPAGAFGSVFGMVSALLPCVAAVGVGVVGRVVVGVIGAVLRVVGRGVGDRERHDGLRG